MWVQTGVSSKICVQLWPPLILKANVWLCHVLLVMSRETLLFVSSLARAITLRIADFISPLETSVLLLFYFYVWSVKGLTAPTSLAH